MIYISHDSILTLCARNWSLPYEDRLKLLKLPSLALRCKVTKLCFLYKIVNNQATAPFPLTPINHDHLTRSHDLCLRNNYARSNLFLNSFFNSTIRLGIDYLMPLFMLTPLISLKCCFKFYSIN